MKREQVPDFTPEMYTQFLETYVEYLEAFSSTIDFRFHGEAVAIPGVSSFNDIFDMVRMSAMASVRNADSDSPRPKFSEAQQDEVSALVLTMFPEPEPEPK